MSALFAIMLSWFVGGQAMTAPGAFCPLQTPEEWQRFIERYAGNPNWVETCEDSECNEEYFAFVDRNVARMLETCGDFIARNPSIAACTQNMRRFVPAWMRQHDGVSYGFAVDNRTYLAAQEGPGTPPGMMTPPAAIVKAMPNLARVEAAARREGLKYLTHDSAIDGTRTFVLYSDPQGRFDQWLLLNLKNSRLQSNQPLSVLAVQKRDARGNSLSRVRLHFRDYTIEHGQGGYQLSLNVENNGKCYSCHANGVRQLIARRTPVLDAKPVAGEASAPDFAYARLMEFNRRLRSYGSPDWNGTVHPEDHGPALGAKQGCTDCHDGKSRGTLTVSTSPGQLRKKVLTELSMPYDTNLQTLLERHEMKHPAPTREEEASLRSAFETHGDLARELEESRLPELRKWLLATPCTL